MVNAAPRGHEVTLFSSGDTCSAARRGIVNYRGAPSPRLACLHICLYRRMGRLNRAEQVSIDAAMRKQRSLHR